MSKFFTPTDRVVPVHHPRVLVEVAVTRGAPREALFENTGITAATLADPDGRISYDQFGALERNAIRLTNDPGLALHWGRAIYFSHLGLVGLAVMSSANLADAFRIASQYDIQATPGWDLDLRIENGRGFLTIRETIPRGDLRVFATEAMLSGFHHVAVQALGRNVSIKEMRFNYPRPAHSDLYREFFGDFPLLFDQPVTQVEFDPSVLAERMLTSDPSTAAVVEQFCADEAERTAPTEGVAFQVRKILLANRGARMNVDQVARALQTSARSLRRALLETGSSYQEISESILQARAREQVKQGTAKLEHIAKDLGFTDARSFRRAFKRWTGTSPHEFRRNQG